jgi:hypothetical protein
MDSEEQFSERREMASNRNKNREEQLGERRETASNRNKNREEQFGERRETTSKRNKDRDEQFGGRREMSSKRNKDRDEQFGEKRVKITTPSENIEGTVYMVLYLFIKTYVQYNMMLNFMLPLQSTQKND